VQAVENLTVFKALTITDEKEPNDEAASAQEIATIGARHVISAAINAPGDKDHFAFTAVAGNIYVVELFNVDSRLALAQRDYGCFGGNLGRYSGLSAAVYDPGNNAVVTQCTENAGGNAYMDLEFKAQVNGRYVIGIIPHSEKVQGTYSLRITAKHDEQGAEWDEVQFEPNNNPMIAFPITPGYQNALTSAIDKPSKGVIADRGDTDWYVFRAVAGRSYTVEIYNVESLVNLGSLDYGCFGGNLGRYTGLGLAVSHGLRNELQQIEIQHEGGLDRAPGLSRQSYARARTRPAVSTTGGVRKPFQA